jgi:hypothetical protein
MAVSSNLRVLYQSYPENQFIYKTVEISHTTFNTIYLYQYSEDIESLFKLENGSEVLFSPSQFEISEPNSEVSENSKMSLNFGPANLAELNEIIGEFEENPISFLEPIKVIYRIYHSRDILVGPSTDPIKMYIETATLTPLDGATLTLTTTNNFRYGTGTTYSLADFPGMFTNA